MEKDSAKTSDIRDAAPEKRIGFGPIFPTPFGPADFNSQMVQAYLNMGLSNLYEFVGLMRDTANLMDPFWNAAINMAQKQRDPDKRSQLEAADELLDFVLLNMKFGSRIATSGFGAMTKYHGREMESTLNALSSALFQNRPDDLLKISDRRLKAVNMIVKVFPQAIRDIVSEYGFHFDAGGYVRVAETPRFELYQILPLDREAKVNEAGKPTLIIPPYVLGANILALLPGENRSYVHAFANQGIPTYIRIVKDIETTPAVQLMTGEDDARDTAYFCEKLLARHGKPVTLNGYCQGGFLAIVGMLSGELDDLADALITCVTPVDGSRCKSLAQNIESLPPRFRDLGYSLKTLPSGNKVVDGKMMGWSFKLRSLERDAPILAFYRDLSMFEGGEGSSAPGISKLTAAVNHWLTYDTTDLPVEITRLSQKSFSYPISKDGTLPFRLFDRPLNLGRFREKGMKWLLCFAENDDLIDREAALAATDFVNAEIVSFPKGHASIATSWSFPASECSLDMDFFGTACSHGQSRGPVRFQLDLDDAANLRKEELTVYWNEMEDNE